MMISPFDTARAPVLPPLKGFTVTLFVVICVLVSVA